MVHQRLDRRVVKATLLVLGVGAADDLRRVSSTRLTSAAHRLVSLCDITEFSLNSIKIIVLF